MGNIGRRRRRIEVLPSQEPGQPAAPEPAGEPIQEPAHTPEPATR